jgi:hypothetical protein
MAKTATEIEVKKTTTTKRPTTKNAASALQEQFGRGKWLWIAPSAALLIAGGVTFVIVRRQQHSGRPTKKRMR